MKEKKQRRPERTRGQVACAAVVSFPNARGDRASEWANERAWDEKNHFASLISFVQGRRGRGTKFTSFVSNYPRLSFIVFAPRSRFCYFSVPAIQAIKTKFN